MDEEDFIAAMRAEPDNAALMGVFADFLEERGDERAGAYRVLWEAGSVGERVEADSEGSVSIGGYWRASSCGDSVPPIPAFACVANGWAGRADLQNSDQIDDRLRLVSAWLTASEEDRRWWREQTLTINENSLAPAVDAAETRLRVEGEVA